MGAEEQVKIMVCNDAVLAKMNVKLHRTIAQVYIEFNGQVKQEADSLYIFF